MDKGIIELSNMLEKKARNESSFLPIDRYFLEPYLEKILHVDRNSFLLYNLDRMSNTYTIQLLLCLPELWEDITTEDLIEIITQFSNEFSYYTLIEFTYKYIEINIIELILKLQSVPQHIKIAVLNGLYSSLYLNLLKTEGDYLFFDENIYGVTDDDWSYARHRLLDDNRVKPTLKTLEQIKQYLSIRINLLTNDAGSLN